MDTYNINTTRYRYSVCAPPITTSYLCGMGVMVQNTKLIKKLTRLCRYSKLH